ncbi:hypothetical protein Taro_046483 [Colocasia esculenta]|uniref:Uncharacterized protein n=1 Tax=Colocasia esculenta TaxID=4460 RepID=A0A843X2D5_COLES|nr:hypothetical protein [Colocasia esculenta]
MRAVAADRAGNDGLEGDCPCNRPRAILCVPAGSAVKILASTSVDAEFFIGRLTARIRVAQRKRGGSTTHILEN